MKLYTCDKTSITAPDGTATQSMSCPDCAMEQNAKSLSSSVHIMNDKERHLWDDYVASSESATCYHLSGWRSVVEKSFSHKSFYLYSKGNDGRIYGILPLVNLKSVLFGNFMISMPYFNYGGLCTTDDKTAAQLLDAAIDIALKQKATHIELRHFQPIPFSLQVKTAKVAMHLQLPPNSDELWKSLSSKLRSQIKRPLKDDVTAAIGGEECLDDFYKVFSENMRDLGTPVYNKMFFRNILLEFPATTRICLVRLKDGVTAAAGFLIGFKNTLEIPWASSLRRFNNLSPNMLLYWTSLKYACENSYTVFDFGRSTPGEGTYKFKEQWGAKPLQLYWHYWMKDNGNMPEINPHNPKYDAAIRVWQKLPLVVTNLIGPSIVKNLP